MKHCTKQICINFMNIDCRHINYYTVHETRLVPELNEASRGPPGPPGHRHGEFHVDTMKSYSRVFDVLPALKGEDSSVGSFETAVPSRDDGRPAVSRTTSDRSDNPRLSACGFVDAPSAPRGVWRVGDPLGVARTAGGRCVAPIPVQGDGPRAAPSAFPTVEATQSGPTGRGLLFVCRRDSIAAASETPSRERYGSLRRPGGTQSNRQFLPLLGD